MKRKSFGLKEYSLLTASFILGNKMHAQVVYTDLEPDIMLDAEIDGIFDIFNLDMDGNGVYDFSFLNTFNKFEANPFSSFSYIFRKDACFIGTYWWDDVKNYIIGTRIYYSGNYGGGFYNYHASAIEFGILINNEKPMYDNSFAALAVKVSWYQTEWGWNPWREAGNWFPSEEDKYIGVKFQDSDEDFHFGWIRCSVLDSAKVLVIKDYAYEAHAGKPIHAGDTSNLISSIEEEQHLEANIYAFDQTIFIQLKTKEETQINIYNLLGEKIYSEKINTNTTEIKRKETGIFIVELLSGDKKMVKKVFVE